MIGEILEIIGLILSGPDKANGKKTSRSMAVTIFLAVVISTLLSIFLIQKIRVTENFQPIIVSASVSFLLTFMTLKILQKRNSLSALSLTIFLLIIYAVFLMYMFAGFFVSDFVKYS